MQGCCGCRNCILTYCHLIHCKYTFCEILSNDNSTFYFINFNEHNFPKHREKSLVNFYCFRGDITGFLWLVKLKRNLYFTISPNVVTVFKVLITLLLYFLVSSTGCFWKCQRGWISCQRLWQNAFCDIKGRWKNHGKYYLTNWKEFLLKCISIQLNI